MRAQIIPRAQVRNGILKAPPLIRTMAIGATTRFLGNSSSWGIAGELRVRAAGFGRTNHMSCRTSRPFRCCGCCRWRRSSTPADFHLRV